MPIPAVLTDRHIASRDARRGTWDVLAMTAVMMACFFGCGRDPYNEKYARTQPNAQALPGEWSLTEWTMKRGQSLPSPSSKIVFEADGAFKATNYPAEAVAHSGTSGGLLDGEGTWAIESSQDF